MCEVNVDNFKEKFPEIKRTLKEAKFIAVDLEFSALYPLKNHTPSLFDNASERYLKLKKNLENVIPIQIGLTAFTSDPDTNSYTGTVYNFYVIPATFPTIQRLFYFQSDTLSFLRLHGFDFNKFAYLGIPYINKAQEDDLRKNLNNNSITEMQSSLRIELESIFEIEGESVKKWYSKAEEGEQLSLPKIYEKYNTNYEILYFVHKHFRCRFRNLWTVVENKQFILKKVSSNEFNILSRNNDLEEELISDLLGFTKVFRLLTATQKPIVGHNLLQDILLMLHNFVCPLPNSYTQFKKLTTRLFPAIYDTKSVSYYIMSLIPQEKRWNDSGLSSLFEYFKNGTGRHLVLNSPAIELQTENSYGKFHEAGWDSFCAGYVFIRLAYLNIYHKFPKSKQFVSSELIGGLSNIKNEVNVIRGSLSSIKLDGDDPESTRPPYLVIESVKRGPVNIAHVLSALSAFGFVEIRKLPHQKKRALVAVDNFGNARRILKNFQNHSEFHVSQYSALKHSPVVRAFLLSGITVSGVILIWMTRSILKS